MTQPARQHSARNPTGKPAAAASPPACTRPARWRLWLLILAVVLQIAWIAALVVLALR